MSRRTFGHITDYPEGSWFQSRRELSQAGVHAPLQAGISGSEKGGADSIVLSGGYEDDNDLDDIIIYTGHGGRDPVTGLQTTDQLLTRGNRALALSSMQGLPVRVIRGSSHRSPYSPPSGYRYDGLYRVEDYWRENGKSGHTIWRFRLSKTITPSPIKKTAESPATYDVTPRQITTIQRIVRDTEKARTIKELYEYRCQVCQIQLVGSAGPYAEAAHIRPLGRPHNGPDSEDNILCLCPNHHVLFDYGGFTIAEDFTLLGLEGKLTVHQTHKLSNYHITYHRNHYYRSI